MARRKTKPYGEVHYEELCRQCASEKCVYKFGGIVIPCVNLKDTKREKSKGGD